MDWRRLFVSLTLSQESNPISLRNHEYEYIAGLRIFVCLSQGHAYETKQNFDFCPSCGRDIRKVVSSH